MNGDAAIDILMQRCGNRQDTTFRANILAEMVLAQDTTLEKNVLLPWFLLRDTNELGTNLTWVAGEETLALPSGFLGFDDDLGCGVWFYDATASSDPDPWVEMKRKPYPTMKSFSRNVGDDTTDFPYYFDIVGSSLYFRPVQASDQTVRLIYLGADSAPTDTAATNLWLTEAADLLIAQTGMTLAQNYIFDMEMENGFKTQVAQAMNRLVAKNEHMKHMLQTYTMGD